MSEENDVTETSAKWVAEFTINSLKDARGLIWNQHTDSFKWILASLLAINSGGAFAVLNSSIIQMELKKIPFLLFVMGMLLAILVAVAAQKLSARTIPILHRQIGFWLTVLEDGKIPLNLSEIEASDQANVNKFQWIVPTIGWLSALAFVAGVIALGQTFAEKKPALVANPATTQGTKVGNSASPTK